MGVAGVAVAGAIASTAAIVASIALLGQMNSIPVWAANHPDQPPRNTVALALKATSVMLPIALVPTLAISVPLLAGYSTQAVLAVGISLAALGQLWGLLVGSLLSTFRGPRAILKQTTLAALVSAALTCGAVVMFGSAWLPLALGAGSFAGQAIATIALYRVRRWGGEVATSAPLWPYVRSGMDSFPGILINAIVIGGLPLVVLTLTTETAAGLFRSAWTLSTILLAASVALLKSMYFPEASRAVAQDSSTTTLHMGTVGRAALIACLGSVGMCLFAPLLLTVFYSAQFVQASSSVAALSVLSTARVGLSLNAYWLNANSRGKDFSLLEGMFLTLLLLGVIAGSRVGTPLAISLGCALAGTVSLAASDLLIHRRHLARPLASIPWWGLALAALQLSVAMVIVVADLPR